MSKYRNVGPVALQVAAAMIGRDVAPAGDEEGLDEFETDADVVHHSIERLDGSTWVNTAFEVDEAAEKAAEQPEKAKRTTKRSTKRSGGERS